MIKLKETVIVEGKYDKITLSDFIDATIIVTNGFRIFKDKEKCELISLLAAKNGLIIITDSDSAGMMIRRHIKKICNSDNIINVYIPQIKGKEKRKSSPSKEGFLGVEGMNEDIISDCLTKSGVFATRDTEKTPITKNDLYKVGLSGKDNSAKLREDFLSKNNLPIGISSNTFLDVINAVFNNIEFFEAVEKWQSEGDKN